MFKFILGCIVGAIVTVYAFYLIWRNYSSWFRKPKRKRKYNCKRDLPDQRDFRFKIVKIRVEPLLAVVDLRSQLSPVVDQGNLGSCTANAIVSGLWEYLWVGGNILQRFSRLFLYYFERLLEGTVKEDSGAYIRDGMKSLQKTGVCTEKLWPYIIKKFTKRPGQEAIDEAGKYKICEYQRINTLQELKMALADGQPVVFGFEVFESFETDSVTKTGLVPMPQDSEESLGGHAVLAVGYDDVKGWVIVRNSWGEAWGDKGYFYMPYDVFKKLVMDMWTGK